MIYQEKIFTKEECDEIISYHKIPPRNELKWDFKNNSSGKYENNRVTFGNGTNYNTYGLFQSSETEWVFNRLLNWFSNQNGVKLNENIKHGFCTLHNYIVGDKFQKHIDLMQGFDDRRYNAGIQLNDEYEGGEYVCWDYKNNEIVFSKEAGTAVSYHCRTPHQINEITKGNRWSLVMPIHNWEIIEKKNLM
jgi:hypothetical protein